MRWRPTRKFAGELALLVVCLLIVLAGLLSVTVMIGWVVEHVAKMVAPD